MLGRDLRRVFDTVRWLSVVKIFRFIDFIQSYTQKTGSKNLFWRSVNNGAFSKSAFSGGTT